MNSPLFWVWIISGVVLFAICGSLAESKGYRYRPFALLGFLLGIIGLIIVLVMPDAKAQQETIDATREVAKSRPKQTSMSHKTTTPADELLKYKRLLDEGAITQGEYDAMKAKLLNVDK